MIERLAIVGKELVGWSSGKYENLGKQIDKAEKALRVAQQAPISKENCDEATLEKALDDFNDKYEAYWYIRSRVSEVRDGDRNTNYFHHKASQRKKRNQIAGLFDSTGVWQPEEADIERIISHYYEDLFATSNPLPGNIEEVLKLVHPVNNDDINRELWCHSRKIKILRHYNKCTHAKSQARMACMQSSFNGSGTL